MATTTDTATLQLTPARKRLIRQAIRTYKGELRWDWLRSLPSFYNVPTVELHRWIHSIEAALTPATLQPAIAETPTGEFYTLAGISAGLGVSLVVVEAWQHFGWLSSAGGGPLYSAADIRAFVRRHPSEIRPAQLRDDSWLWLVSVLAGSREGAA